jgi:hypothetical protein
VTLCQEVVPARFRYGTRNARPGYLRIEGFPRPLRVEPAKHLAKPVSETLSLRE